QAEDGIRDRNVTGVQTCALPIYADVKVPFYYYKNAGTHVFIYRQDLFEDNFFLVFVFDEKSRFYELGSFGIETPDRDTPTYEDRSEERRVGKEVGNQVGLAPVIE